MKKTILLIEVQIALIYDSFYWIAAGHLAVVTGRFIPGHLHFQSSVIIMS